MVITAHRSHQQILFLSSPSYLHWEAQRLWTKKHNWKFSLLTSPSSVEHEPKVQGKHTGTVSSSSSETFRGWATWAHFSAAPLPYCPEPDSMDNHPELYNRISYYCHSFIHSFYVSLWRMLCTKQEVWLDSLAWTSLEFRIVWRPKGTDTQSTLLQGINKERVFLRSRVCFVQCLLIHTYTVIYSNSQHIRSFSV